MLKCPDPPPRGAFVEVRRKECCIVGHVRWSLGGHFGVRSQEAIDLSALTGDQLARSRGGERRVIDRSSPAPQALKHLGHKELQSRLIARYANWLVIAVAGMLAAAFVVEVAGSVFGTAMQRARAGMETPK